MKLTKYSERQILAILRQAEGGVPVAELCLEHGMSNASFYMLRAKYGGMDASMVSQMKMIEEENRRLKKMFVELSMQNESLNNLTPADVYHDRGRAILLERERIKRHTIQTRRLRHSRKAA
jgi:putative transposase